MADLFKIYFSLGYEHILDPQGIDHVLFIITLAAVYSFWDWKKVVWLATAFTIGHSITLALSVLDVFTMPSDIIEYAIPVTIIVTAISNLIKGIEKTENRQLSNNFYYAIFFGLIHGMGFSNYLKRLLSDQDSIWLELLSFNLGLEIGQIVVVTIFLTIGFLLQRVVGVKKRDWNIGISSATLGMAILLILNM